MAEGRHVAPRAKGQKKLSGVELLIVILIGILLVIAIAIPIMMHFVRDKIERMNYVPTEVDEKTGELVIEVLDELPEGFITEETEEKSEETEAEIVLPEGEAIVDEGILNILLIGTDPPAESYGDTGRADVTMLCSINKKEGTVKLISFERGIMVPIPDHGTDLLTHSYVWGGVNLLMKDLQDCFLLNFDGYMLVTVDTFQEIIDAIGGIDVELSEEEAYAINHWYKNESSDLVESGMTHLDGFSALRFCRLRRIDDNFGRIGRQRRTIQAIMDKAKDMSLSELNEAANATLPLVETNIEAEVFMDLVKSAPKFLKLKAEQYQVPEGHDSSKIDFVYESDRLAKIIYGE